MNGYKTACESIGDDERVLWYTTSPEVLYQLSNNGCKVKSLEERVTPDIFSSIGKASYGISNAISDILEKRYALDNSLNIDQIFGWSIQIIFNVFCYKSFLLDTLVNESEDCDIFCVGSNSLTPINGLNFAVGRFDTIYSILASESHNIELKVILHEENKERLYQLCDYVKHRKMDFYEKILSILNNTPSSFFYKLWRLVSSNTSFKKIRIFFYPRKNIFVHRDCELIEESFIAEMIKGASFSRLPVLPNIKHTNTIPDHNYSSVKSELLKACKESLNHNGFEYSEIIETGCILAINRILKVVNNFCKNQENIHNEFEQVLAKIGKKGELRSNFFSHPIEKMFAIYCLDKGVPVTAYEHGVTLGLSKWSQYPAQYWGMQLASIGVYHCHQSVNQLKPWIKDQKVIIKGMPTTTKKINFIFFQKRLVKKWLKIKVDKKVVMYIADLERNNSIHGPFQENDYQYLNTTRNILYDLSYRFPHYTILLKLYPTHRYPESYTFTDLIKKIPNLKIIQNMDFRYIRSAADIIALSSSQSTLGWAAGSNAEILFYEKKANPSCLDGKELESSINGVNRLFILNKESIK